MIGLCGLSCLKRSQKNVYGNKNVWRMGIAEMPKTMMEISLS